MAGETLTIAADGQGVTSNGPRNGGGGSFVVGRSSKRHVIAGGGVYLSAGDLGQSGLSGSAPIGPGTAPAARTAVKKVGGQGLEKRFAGRSPADRVEFGGR